MREASRMPIGPSSHVRVERPSRRGALPNCIVATPRQSRRSSALKVGSKVTIEYRMTATSVEVKEAKAAGAAKRKGAK